MIDEPDFIKINKELSKRIQKRESKDPQMKNGREINDKEESISETRSIKVSPEKLISLENKRKKLTQRRKELNEAWRLAVAEGDDRETDAITITVQLLHENELEMIALEKTIKNSVVIDDSYSQVIQIGSIVTYLSENGISNKITLVEDIEADPITKKISDRSPLGSCLIGKKVGDHTSYTSPNGVVVKIKVTEIQ